LQIRHGITDGADAGQLDERCLADDLRITRNDRILAQAAPGIIDVGQIADFIIDDRYFQLEHPFSRKYAVCIPFNAYSFF
jgi:hypothetical protein